MNINLHIERLVLDGIPMASHQRAQLKAAVESELSHLLISNGIGSAVQSGNNFREVPGGLISFESNDKPSHIGQQVAGAVHQGIRK